MNYTFAMIKPDAVAQSKVGEIIDIIEKDGFIIKRMEMKWLNNFDAEELYEMHSGKDFYHKLIVFTTSAPVVLLLLKKENSVEELRKVVDNIRFLYSNRDKPEENLIHGSDSDESALREISLFFGGCPFLNKGEIL
jgi:nucleoside-diphosphate kinase